MTTPLLAVAKAWERDVVLPHCPQCTRPCCALTDVVLDLSFAEAQALYRITKKDPLPQQLRKQRGRYYAHGARCPAFDDDHRCRVYHTPHKPQGCSDFPLYDDDGELVADLRCEAVRDNVTALEDALLAALDAGQALDVVEDREFADTFLRFVIA